nr:hypothetical protein [Tanacetum cinerariifolium]
DLPILDEVIFKIHKNSYFVFDPLRNMVWVEEDDGLHCFSSTPFSTRIKKKHDKTTKEGLKKKVKPGMVDDELVGRKSFQTSRKGKGKMYELPGTLTKESQVVTNYKRTIINGKAKMVEVDNVGLVQEKVDVGNKEDVGKTNVLSLMAPGNKHKQPVVLATKV